MTPEIWGGLAGLVIIGIFIVLAMITRIVGRRSTRKGAARIKAHQDEYEKFWQEQRRAQGDENDT